MRTLKTAAVSSVMGFMALVLAVLAQPRPAAAADLAAMLDQLPDDAAVVIAVPNAGALSKKIVAFQKAIGIEDDSVADVLDLLKKQTGMVKGVREDGPVLMYLADIPGLAKEVAGGGGEGGERFRPAIVLLVPVSDYAAAVKELGGDADGAVTPVRFAGSGRDSYARKVGDFLAVSPQEDLIAKLKPAKRGAGWIKIAGKLGGKVIEDADALVLADVEHLATHLRPALKTVIEREMGNLEGMGMGAMVPMMKGYAAALDCLMRDTTAMVLSVGLTDKGVNLNWAAQFVADSPTAKLFPGSAGGADLLRLLPNQEYLMAAAVDMQAVSLGKLMTDFMALVPKEMQETLAPLVKGYSDMLAKSRGMASAMYLATMKPGEMPSKLMTSVSVTHSDDPAALRQAMKDMVTAMDKFKFPDMGAGPAAAGDGAAMEVLPVRGPPRRGPKPAEPGITTKYTSDAAEIDGVKVDLYEMNMVLPPDLTEGNPLAGVMAMMGAMQQKGYIGVWDKYLITTDVDDPAAFKAALAAVKEGKGLGTDARLLAARKAASLGGTPAMEVYLGTGTMAGMVNFVGAMMGGVFKVEGAKDLPPMAMTVNIQDGGMGGRVHVPTPAIKFFVDLAKQLEGMFMPGGGV